MQAVMRTETIPVKPGFRTIQPMWIITSPCMYCATTEGTCHSLPTPDTTLSGRHSEFVLREAATVEEHG